jgi:hypothetical protein
MLQGTLNGTTYTFNPEDIEEVIHMYREEGARSDWWHIITSTDGTIFDINVTGSEYNWDDSEESYAIYPIIDEITDHTQWLNATDLEEVTL